ncbi:hypothetical protein R3P38DRAFT_2518492, partial [Favolaschia claudopus]
SRISADDLAALNQQLDYINEHDEHGDVATGDQEINESLIDEVFDNLESNQTAAEVEFEASEAQPGSVLQNQLRGVLKRLLKEINKYNMPLCYRRGDFFDRPPHPVFALRCSLEPTQLYWRKVFIWLPNLLPGCPSTFKCTCGKPLIRNGFNDPIARRVRSMPADYFLLTNRFLCPPRRQNNPGCGRSFQGTDPHILGQLPLFVQRAFPAYITARAAVSKLVMWQMLNTFSSRLGPAKFSGLVSEIQYRTHAETELMYISAANHYRQFGVKQFSAFDDPHGYAGSPPSTPYLKGLFTDYTNANRIYVDRYIASLPLTVASGDHTFAFLKHTGGLKGEPIFTAAYTLMNEHEEVRGHCFVPSKSMTVLQEMFQGVKQGLQDANNLPTQLFYTDSPQRT